MEKTSTTYGRENDGKNGTNSNFFICSCVIYLMLFYFFKFCSYSSVCLCARLRKGQAWGGGSPIVKMQGCPSSRFGASDRSKLWSDRGPTGRKSSYFYPYRYRLGLFIKKINQYIVVKQTRDCNTVAVKSAFDDFLSSLRVSPCSRVAISRALLYLTLSTITIENEGLLAVSGIV